MEIAPSCLAVVFETILGRLFIFGAVYKKTCTLQWQYSLEFQKFKSTIILWISEIIKTKTIYFFPCYVHKIKITPQFRIYFGGSGTQPAKSLKSNAGGGSFC